MIAVVLPLLAAVIVVAWLTAAATAVRSVSRIWLRHWVERQLSGSPTAEAYLARPQRLVLAAGAGVALFVTLAGMIAGATSGATTAPAWVLAAIVIALALAFLIFGQLLPRAIARRWATRLIPVLLPPLHALAWVVSPLLRAAQAITRTAGPRRHALVISPREGIEDLLREGELEGIGEPAEIEIITGVVQFGEKVLRDVMTPRTDVFAVDVDMPPAELTRAIAQSGYSRVPVYRGSLDEVIGMVHVFDLLKVGADGRPPIREVAHAPATKRCSEMLFEMLRGQRHLAVVLDEFGGTAGIVTLEDVLEELVGDIRDEHDEPAAPVQPQAPRALVLDASTPLDDVARQFGVAVPTSAGRDRATSVGGAVVQGTGRIPALGERFRLGELEITVVDAEPARVRRVLVQRADSARPVELNPAR
ncbi:MAG: HlyC/CorC family transporter [Gemmatimonadaceae bacterium]|nr:HlyC/CorC family transporter [Gemmatimonadaceae bacterium]